MNKSVIAVSAVVGSAAALVTCLAFFFFVYKPAQSRGIEPPSPSPTRYSAPTPLIEIPNPEVMASDVKSISINTIYKGYFEPGNKCAKSYNEYFGNDDGSYSPSSPCTITITFDRDGRAARSIEITRWDKVAKEKRPVEKGAWTGDVSTEQFQTLAQTVVANDAFRSWREGMMITISNCSITVVHAGGTRSVLSNVDEKTTVYLQMIDAIKKLESQIKWKGES